MATIYDTAKYILEQRGEMSAMKLQGLCYYSQAWSLVWDDTPLFEEDFQAWANGPVCPELFFAYQEKEFLSANDMRGDSSKLSDNQKDTVDIVLNHCADKNARRLNQLIKMEGPWALARNGISTGSCNVSIITKDSIAMHYSEFK